MSSHKTTKNFRLPSVDKQVINQKVTLPFNGNAVSEKSFSFSFACFDRTHELFNLGDNTADGVISGKWFLDLLDCLKSVSNKTVAELKVSMHDLHPITWSSTNTNAPFNSEQYDFWQFRINKSKGRVIGFLIDGVFYVVWLDPHHNLTDSEGYGGINKFKAGISIYETQENIIANLNEQIEYLQNELHAAEELLNE